MRSACAMNFRSILKAAALAAVISAVCGCSTARFSESEEIKIDQTRFLGSVWNQSHAEASIISQDGGLSYSVPGGSLWWFGDTFKGSRDANGTPHFAGGAVSCDVAFLKETDRSVPPKLRFYAGPDGTVAQAIPFLADESWDHHRIWPLGGVYLNGKSYVYYSLIEIGGKGQWDFHSVGEGLACSTEPLSVHQRIQTANGWRFPVAPACVVVADGWVYLYDVQKRADRQGIWLSRVRPAEIENPDAYQFYCGPEPTFCPDKSKQVPLIENIYGQTSVIWNEYLQKYILASSSDFFHSREIRFHTADHPFGPWTRPVASIEVPEYRQGKKVELVYCSYFHPELSRENGRLMILTFSLMLTNSGFDANNEIVEVELSPR
jgi:hypothetical protein